MTDAEHPAGTPAPIGTAIPAAGALPIGGTPIQRRLADAAVELFYARGARATTVRDITAACDLTPGALYNHFTSKEHLLYVLVVDIHRQVDGQMAAELLAAGSDPVAQLTAMAGLLAAHTARFKKQSRMANREFTVLTGERRADVTAIRRSIRERIAGTLLAGARQGTFDLPGSNDEAGAELAAATIINMCVHISERTLEHYPHGIDDLRARFAAMALRIAGHEAPDH